MFAYWLSLRYHFSVFIFTVEEGRKMRVRKISCLHQDLIGIIGKVSDVMNIRDIEYSILFGTDDIDCFLGGLHSVYIRGIKDCEQFQTCLVIKWHSNFTDRMCFRAAYRREHVFYHYIAPKMLEFQRSYKIIEGLKFKFLNCLITNIAYDKEYIVFYKPTFEYKLLNRFHKMDINHCSLVLQNLAKLHGLSFALQKLSPKEFEVIRNLSSQDIQYFDAENIPKSLVYYFKASLNVISNADARAKLEGISQNISKLLSKCSAPVSEYSAICHGDCWNNNIMFKYKGERPVDIIFVDYQLVRYASPATDISYFLYMSTDRGILFSHYDQLLDIYYGTLSGVLRQFNLDVNEVYPKNILQKHLRDYSILGLIEALISMKIITAETDEALKMTEMKYHAADEPYQDETENQVMYVERINGVVNHFFNRKYSLDGILSL